jgi:hypothetical protein
MMMMMKVVVVVVTSRLNHNIFKVIKINESNKIIFKD